MRFALNAMIAALFLAMLWLVARPVGPVELDTPYVPPPGDARTHHAAGCAKIMCSAVFITGLAPEFAFENVGYFTCPPDERAAMGTPVIDREARTASVTGGDGVTRVARYLGEQGCVTLPHGQDSVQFTPRDTTSESTDTSRLPWPDGDTPPSKALPEALDRDMIEQAVDAAFAPDGALTAAFVVTWKGRIVAERYGPGVTMHTPLESWSMGKSLTAALMGVLIEDGVYRLEQPAPVPQWQTAGDPRAKITVSDLLRMSSGLRIRAPQDPGFDEDGPYPDHLYLYTGCVDSFDYAATRPLQYPPGTVGRYRNTDPVLVNYLIRLAVEKRGGDYLSFPARALLDKIGIRGTVMETDPFGNFLSQGYVLAPARDWARLGNLFLQDGMWNGERILPEGYARFVSTPAPAWRNAGNPVYGGFFWINGDGGYPVPKDAYAMVGAGGQFTFIIPSHDLVVVRMGHARGNAPGAQGLVQALDLLMRAVPRRE